MPVKTQITLPETVHTDFPKLMKHELVGIVLFTSPGVGTLVAARKSFRAGHYSTDWTMSKFHDYYGKVTLENM